jgi:4'-phosphopantetheinyl transferase
MIRTLPLDRVDLWYTLTSDVDSELLQHYRAILDEAERGQADRFVFDQDRQQYTIAKALTRTTLSRYLPLPPEDWQFARNRYGRPEIAVPGLPTTLRFNLTHTRGLVACAVVVEHDLGIDAEHVNRRDVGPEVAEHFFSAAEVAALKRLAGSEVRRAFFAYWTLKEAYIKARGMGLSLPLDQFSFDLRQGAPPRISFSEAIVDRAEDWQFEQLALTGDHLAALALRRGERANLRLNVERVVPLAG